MPDIFGSTADENWPDDNLPQNGGDGTSSGFLNRFTTPCPAQGSGFGFQEGADPYRIVLTMPPSQNAAIMPGLRGRRPVIVHTKEARRWIAETADYCGRHRLVYGTRKILGMVEVRIRLFMARNSGDIDGRAKKILDSIQGYGYQNDSQVRRLVMEMETDPENPRAEVEVVPFTRA